MRTTFFHLGSCNETMWGIGSEITTTSVIRLTIPVAKYDMVVLPHVPAIVWSQYMASGRHMVSAIRIVANAQHIIMAPVTLAAMIILRTEKTLMYNKRIDDLRRVRVAGHKNCPT